MSLISLFMHTFAVVSRCAVDAVIELVVAFSRRERALGAGVGSACAGGAVVATRTDVLVGNCAGMVAIVSLVAQSCDIG